MQSVFDHKTIMLAATDCGVFDIDAKNNILQYHQVRKLDSILNETLVICGECGLPTISVTIKDFILAVKHKLELYQFPMIDMRLNGGGAAAVLGESFWSFVADCRRSLLSVIPSCGMRNKQRRISYSTVNDFYLFPLVSFHFRSLSISLFEFQEKTE